ncbi:hypothetical protein, partial [Klebsiella aerogenes]|uniref:hypothetical protein n=1 Tax=Klebsiella aerogenes TaxID=548 RepID=UPI00280F2294
PCIWGVLAPFVLEPTACELGTAIFFFIGFEPYFYSLFYLAQVKRFSGSKVPPVLKNLNIV